MEFHFCTLHLLSVAFVVGVVESVSITAFLVSCCSWALWGISVSWLSLSGSASNLCGNMVLDLEGCRIS